jgi:dTDP-4-amino-4,6-dideoxygalactose transaminase
VIQGLRKSIWNRYRLGLAEWGFDHGVQLPYVPEHCEQTYHIYHLVLPSVEARQALIRHLAARGIAAVFHYQPLHLSEMGRRFGGRRGQCPVTESVGDRLLRLPLYARMTDEEVERVIEAVTSFDFRLD